MQTAKFSFSQNFISFFVALLVKLIALTIRWEVRGKTLARDSTHWSQSEPAIMVFWHAQQIMMYRAYYSADRSQDGALYALASRHGDGRLIAALLSKLGIKSVAGSSSKGSVAALKALFRCLRAGNHLAITPDGPRGPAFKVKPGALALAIRTGAPLVPFAIIAPKRLEFSSWDRIFIPYPFSKVLLVGGAKMYFSPNTSLGDAAQELEAELNRLNSTKF